MTIEHTAAKVSSLPYASAIPMAGPVVDCQSDAVRTTPRRITVGLLAIVSVTWLVVREGDLAAYPGGNLVLACGIFIVLSRILPH